MNAILAKKKGDLCDLPKIHGESSWIVAVLVPVTIIRSVCRCYIGLRRLGCWWWGGFRLTNPVHPYGSLLHQVASLHQHGWGLRLQLLVQAFRTCQYSILMRLGASTRTALAAGWFLDSRCESTDPSCLPCGWFISTLVLAASVGCIHLNLD